MNRFRIVPDPPVAGQPCTVTYIGPATEVEWQVDGKHRRRCVRTATAAS